MRGAIVYTSKTGHTQRLAEEIHRIGGQSGCEFQLSKIHEFSFAEINDLDVLLIGTYTWGSGELPKEMWGLYEALECVGRKDLVTGVFGTGDRFYPNFCGAVDLFRDMLYVQTSLAATFKVELMLQPKERERCVQFVDVVMQKRQEAQGMFNS